MWRLKIAEGDNPMLRTVNNFVGRQKWEFDPNLGTPEELAKVEEARENYRKHRFEIKHNADLIMRIQEDSYNRTPLVQNIICSFLHKVVEPIFISWPGKKLREKALNTLLQQIHYEDENTRYVCYGSINKVSRKMALFLFLST
ncbi:putative Cycloartenol synthase [Cocos nucifera]|uniref:Putative Cycloartenol synthase n=1 Tax=Cocos nucifera TaxID=13894 RepID=A0A8K0IHE0_COCNU|nr:putative Cycloartenol synthase [Cocos nucifera]